MYMFQHLKLTLDFINPGKMRRGFRFIHELTMTLPDRRMLTFDQLYWYENDSTSHLDSGINDWLATKPNKLLTGKLPCNYSPRQMEWDLLGTEYPGSDFSVRDSEIVRWRSGGQSARGGSNIGAAHNSAGANHSETAIGADTIRFIWGHRVRC